jgi:hypothetical protein
MPYVWRCQISYNGSGTFNINTAGQPVVTGTVISSTAFNALTADLGTGLSTAITKDGQTVATARIPFAAGINSSLVTDATSTTTGSIITAGGVGIAKALYVGTTANIAGASTFAAVNASTLVTTTSIGVGNVTLSGSGSGVQFPATQSASTNANTLDDYEEGTWTPVDGSGASLSFTTANATYTKVGRFVSLVCSLSFPSTASASVANISGFPFTIATNAYPPAITMTDALINIVGNGMSATTGMRLWKQGSNQYVINVEMSLKSLDFVINYSV